MLSHAHPSGYWLVLRIYVHAAVGFSFDPFQVMKGSDEMRWMINEWEETFSPFALGQVA